MYTKIRFNYQIEHRLFEYVNTREILANGMDLIVTKGRQRISAFKTWYNSPKIRNLKLCILFSLNVFFNFFNSNTNKLLMFKNVYLSSYNLSF